MAERVAGPLSKIILTVLFNMKWFFSLLVLLLAAALGWGIYTRLAEQVKTTPEAQAGPVPVEVAPVERGLIELRRTFSGTLEAWSEIVIAPKVGGRVVKLTVDLADPVKRGQVIAELDDDEHIQAVAQSAAELAVARANLAEAISATEIASRELERVNTLQQRGVTSESQFDAAKAQELAKRAAIDVANAHVRRAEAALETARIRLSYTRVTASWAEGDDERIVAERFVDEGATVAANTPLMSIVELDPIHAVMFVAERDYGRLVPDQPVTLRTDAYPDETFAGRVQRIAPVFRETSRQARVELEVQNPDHRLKPGMFVRAQVILDRSQDATIVPVQALLQHEGQTGLYVVDAAGTTVTYRPVEARIRENDRVEVVGEGIVGRVVTLGQQLIQDGSAITIPVTRSKQATPVTTHESEAQDESSTPDQTRAESTP